ncbi:zinc finger protein 892-like [Clytia hemisphaerica]|uniref:zinc finger protein 892-like n=1 Tax=Clytia hemisphaerica TaxID=252671 RepID=UPI0034D6C71F
MNIDLGNIKVEDEHESIDRRCQEMFSFQIKTEELVECNSYGKECKTEPHESGIPRCGVDQDDGPKDEQQQSKEHFELKEDVLNHLKPDGEYTFNIIGENDTKVEKQSTSSGNNSPQTNRQINTVTIPSSKNQDRRADSDTSGPSTEPQQGCGPTNNKGVSSNSPSKNAHPEISNATNNNNNTSIRHPQYRHLDGTAYTNSSFHNQEHHITRPPLRPYASISSNDVIHPQSGMPVSQKQMNEAIRYHVISDSDMKFGSLHCHVCKAVFQDIYTFHSHHFVEHKNPEPIFQCDLCQKMFMRRRYLQKHRLLHKGLKPFKCDVCGNVFATASAVRGHMISHSNERPHSCHLCDLKFKTESALNKHVKTHSGLRPYKCNVCEKYFTTATILKSHAQSHKGKTLKCEECGKSFTRRQTLLNHQRLHTGENLHKCPECGKAFTNAGLLKAHLLSHSESRPLECAECGSKFKSKNHLFQHMSRVHSDKRDFPCDKCDAKFKIKQTLERHMLVHTGEKPFKCDICGKAFNQKCSVTRHKFQVHNKKSKKTKTKSESESESESEASESNEDMVDLISEDEE